MKFQPGLVSVILPAHAIHPWLSQAIHSVLAQSYETWELILALNNFESDGIPSSVLEFQTDPRVRVINYGSGLSLSDVLALAALDCRGEFIARLDSDDFCSPSRLELQVLAFRQFTESVLVGSQLNFVDRDDRPIARKSNYPRVTNRGAVPIESPVAHPSVMFRSEAYFSSGGYRRGIRFGYEDYDLWLRMLELGSFVNLGTPLTTYRIHASSMSQALRESQLRGRVATYVTFRTGQELLLGVFDSAVDFGAKTAQLGPRGVLMILLSYLSQTPNRSRRAKVVFAIRALSSSLGTLLARRGQKWL